MKEAKAQAQQITSEANRQIENTIRVIRESQADKEKTRFVRRKIEEYKESLEQTTVDDAAIDRKIEQLRAREQRRAERKAQGTPSQQPESKVDQVKPKTIEPGVKVRIQGQDAVGEVLELSGKKAIVGFGQIRTTIDLKRLEAISNSEYKKVTRTLKPVGVPAAAFDTAQRRINFSQQIDVRGMRVSEALDATQEFIDDAIMLGFNEVRILHGKGTGALKEEIRKYLRTVDLVSNVKDEHEESGGAGITVVKLDL